MWIYTRTRIKFPFNFCFQNYYLTVYIIILLKRKTLIFYYPKNFHWKDNNIL